MAHFGPIKLPDEHSDERFLYLSDVLPTAWQAVEYADIPQGGSVAVFGLGPIGQMSTRIASHRGAGTVIGIDPVSERRDLAARDGIRTLDPTEHADLPSDIRDLTDGRGPDSVIDAVGIEAHGAPVEQTAQQAVVLLPDDAIKIVLHP